MKYLLQYRRKHNAIWLGHSYYERFIEALGTIRMWSDSYHRSFVQYEVRVVMRERTVSGFTELPVLRQEGC